MVRVTTMNKLFASILSLSIINGAKTSARRKLMNPFGGVRRSRRDRSRQVFANSSHSHIDFPKPSGAKQMQVMEDESLEVEASTSSAVTEKFSSFVSQYAYKAAPTPSNSTPRRSPRKASTSPRKPIAVKDESGNGSDLDALESPRPTKRKRPSTAISSLKKQRPPQRGYAPPEVYAHLNGLTDHLKPEMDILFCGINPGKRSAEIGHHFGHPNNHFWKCLHRSGLTIEQLSPYEDSTLPERYNAGLTNLAGRPTSEQNELSKEELKNAVPAFLSKVAKYRPRVVVFVGLNIAHVVQAVLTKAPCNTIPTGLMSFKITYPKDDTTQVAETLFFATPSTSGLVRQFQLPDKIKVFEQLKDTIAQIKSGTLDTTGIVAMSVPTRLPSDVSASDGPATVTVARSEQTVSPYFNTAPPSIKDQTEPPSRSDLAAAGTSAAPDTKVES